MLGLFLFPEFPGPEVTKPRFSGYITMTLTPSNGQLRNKYRDDIHVALLKMQALTGEKKTFMFDPQILEVEDVSGDMMHDTIITGIMNTDMVCIMERDENGRVDEKTKCFRYPIKLLSHYTMSAVLGALNELIEYAGGPKVSEPQV